MDVEVRNVYKICDKTSRERLLEKLDVNGG
jgi:hypothetical protein